MVARADGSHVRVVASRPDLNFGVNPAWSPDGRRLAFVIAKTYPSGYEGNEIVTVRLNGSDSRVVRIPQLPRDIPDLYGIDWTRVAK